MNTGEIISLAFLVIMVALIVWNIRGHPRGGGGSGNQYGPGPDRSESFGASGGGEGRGGD
jgi:hypothetical protein